MLWVYRTQWVKLGFWNKTLKNAVKLLVTRSRMAVRCDNAPVVRVIKKHRERFVYNDCICHKHFNYDELYILMKYK